MKKKTKVKPSVIVNLSGRRFPDSTEIMIFIEPDIPEFYVALGCYTRNEKPIGYMHFKNTGKREKRADGTLSTIYALIEILCPNSTVPGPIFSLSGVLWTRLEAVLAHQQISAYQNAVNQIT